MMRLPPLLRSAHVRFLLLIVVIELCLAGAMLVGVSQQLHNAIDGKEASVAAQQLDDLHDQADAVPLPQFLLSIEARLRNAPARGQLIVLADASGRILSGNIRRWPVAFDTDPAARWIKVVPADGGQPIRYFIGITTIYGDHRLLVGHANERSEALRGAITEAALKSLLIALPLALLGAWLAIRVIEGRIERINATAAAVANGRLSDRVSLDGSNDSFDKLGARVNEMLDRIGSLVEELRVLSDSLAHDLRSPIMRLRARIDQAITSQRAEDDWAEVLGGIGIEADRLHAMLSNALEISRAEAGLARQQMAVQDISRLIADIGELYEPLVEENGRELRLETDGPCPALVHREMLTMAISNLIDNALKYGAGPIILSVGRHDGWTTLCVIDHGPGIAEDQVPVALSRFGRLDNARSKEGAGLGLALVESTIRMHGGTLSFTRVGGAFRICANLPSV